jgi:hypothetical protein
VNPIKIAPPAPRGRSRWAKYGLDANPFPGSGVATNVDYDAYLGPQLERVNNWLAESVSSGAAERRPLLLKGSIGVGKTHILRRIERAVSSYAGQFSSEQGTAAATYHIVTGAGAKSLLLSNLLLEGLHASPPALALGRQDAEFPLVDALFRRLRTSAQLGDVWDALPSSSPLRSPLRRILTEVDSSRRSALELDFMSWLARREFPRAAAERLGVSGRLEGEGEAVRAFAHVCRLSARVLKLRAWVVLIDQLEDLWREHATTPLRRARFLTDLRTLIDEALEGAPVAIVIAWNTEVALPQGRRAVPDIERRLRDEYVALASRLTAPVDLPMLPSEHAYPFAAKYVEAAPASDTRARAKLLAQLKTDQQKIIRGMQQGRTEAGQLVQRAWLDALRGWADELVGH